MEGESNRILERLIHARRRTGKRKRGEREGEGGEREDEIVERCTYY